MSILARINKPSALSNMSNATDLKQRDFKKDSSMITLNFANTMFSVFSVT